MVRRRLYIVGAAIIPTLLWLVALRLVNPAFFFIDDKQVQYSATYYYIGQQLRQGNWPMIVPWQGFGSNLILDSQYGLLNPIYWVQNFLYASAVDLPLATFVLATFYLVVLVAGTCMWSAALGLAGRWCAVAGAAAGLSGFTVWILAASWHPGLVASASLPWLGWSLARPRGRLTVVLVAATAFATFAAGWPWLIVCGGIVAAAGLIESLTRLGARTAALQAMGVAAGALLAAPTQIVTAGAFEWTVRTTSVTDSGAGAVSLIDLFNTFLATAPSGVRFWIGPGFAAPLLLAGGLGVALLPMIQWRRLSLRAPGTITLGLSLALLLLLSQVPSELGPLRWPFRMLSAWQTLLPVALCLLAHRCGLRVTAPRVLMSAGFVAAFTLLAVVRRPDTWQAQGVSVALAAGLTVLLVVVARRPTRYTIAGSLLLIGCIGAFAVRQAPLETGLFEHNVPTQVPEYQHPVGVTPARSLVIPDVNVPGDGENVLTGSNYLYGSGRSGWAYTPLGQRFYQRMLCPKLAPVVCGEGVDFLLSIEPTTGRQWVEVLGLTTLVVVPDDLTRRLRDGLSGQWLASDAADGVTVLARQDAPMLPGRLTFVEQGARAFTIASESNNQQSYRVAPQPGGVVVVGDIYWPGYRAFFNGEPIEVWALQGANVALRLPAGEGLLEVEYLPRGAGLAAASAGLGALVLLVGTVLTAVPVRGRRRLVAGGADAPVH